MLLPDLRNHGKSPHNALMDYPAMAEDLIELLDASAIPQAHVIGHSMGGKAAMRLALTHPARVRSLVAVDIAPRAYDRKHDRIIEALLGLDLSKFRTRAEIERALEPSIPEPGVRRFLLKSAAPNTAGGFQWQMGIREISDNYDRLGEAVEADAPFLGPALFVRGEASDYVTPGDEPRIRQMFPAARFAVLPGAGHWAHADNPDGFQTAVEAFLSKAGQVS
jgi:esterase